MVDEAPAGGPSRGEEAFPAGALSCGAADGQPAVVRPRIASMARDVLASSTSG